MENLLDSRENLVQNLCKRLHLSVYANGLKRLNLARDMLNKMQQITVLDKIGKGERNFFKKKSFKHEQDVENTLSQPSSTTLNLEPLSEDMEKIEEECEEFYSDIVVKDDIDNKWNEHFSNFHIVTNFDDYSVCDERKAVQLLIGSCDDEIEFYLRKGVRCFIIDLFIGTNEENQSSIVRLREKELKISKEFGFPVRSTLVASLSPRLQYTGKLINEDEGARLVVGDQVTITTNRQYSSNSTLELLYVNAHFLFPELKVCDGIFIGPDIQVVIKEINSSSITTVVMHGGILRSRLPVLFPSHCSRFRLSMEELEDITFSKEVGISVVISYVHGTKEYFEELQKCFILLKCDQIRLGARVAINSLNGCEDDFDWMLESYDMFVFDIDPPEKIEKPVILHLCPSGKHFMHRVYNLNKPIIFDPTEIVNFHYTVNCIDYDLIFLYPDRYLVKCNDVVATHPFFALQASIFDELLAAELSTNPFCDISITGSDSLARSCVSASFEMNASLILVCTETGRMAQKLAHYRPKTPILFITSLETATDFIGLFWNITILFYHKNISDSHTCTVFKHLLFGLLYAKSRKMVHHNDNVIFVYGKEPGTKFSDVFQVFKFNEKNFVEHLNDIFFEKHFVK